VREGIMNMEQGISNEEGKGKSNKQWVICKRREGGMFKGETK
jgi:hypothetical protein